MNKLIRLIRHLLHEIVVHFVPSFLKKNLLTCQEVSEILAKKPDLKRGRKIKLKMHLMICNCCNDYLGQMNIIEKSSKDLNVLHLTSDQSKKVDQGKAQAKANLEKFLQKKG